MNKFSREWLQQQLDQPDAEAVTAGRMSYQIVWTTRMRSNHDRRQMLKRMRAMAESLTRDRTDRGDQPDPIMLATIQQIEVELMLLKLELNCAY